MQPQDFPEGAVKSMVKPPKTRKTEEADPEEIVIQEIKQADLGK